MDSGYHASAVMEDYLSNNDCFGSVLCGIVDHMFYAYTRVAEEVGEQVAWPSMVHGVKGLK
tara:strand:- start:229 stop:411 length:183 start_codon:yes stop_codon:yes gene_type:complete